MRIGGGVGRGWVEKGEFYGVKGMIRGVGGERM